MTAYGGRQGGPRPLAPPGSAPESAPAGHGTAATWRAAGPERIGRMRPDLLVRSQKPGIVPLTRLRLGTAADGALRLLRANPAATVGLAFLVTPLLAAWAGTRVVLAPVVTVVEGRGVGGSLARAWTLTRGVVHQLRLLGWLFCALLASLVAVLMTITGLITVAAILARIFLVDVSLPREALDMLFLFAPHLGMLLVCTMTAPYLAAMTCLYYLDRRFEREGYDVTLVRRFQDEAALVARR